MMIRIMLLASLLSVSTALPYCPSTQRFDVAEFPPRCVDCPRVVPNRVNLAQIKTAVHTRRAQKFSPGLPQNATCGCWRAPANQTIDVSLNASWIVSGLVFNTNTRARWLREILIDASADNVTFINWGSYVSPNHTAAAVTIFNLPISARYFRITVLRYANHLINDTSGFPVSVSALVSQTQPFSCDCPMLSTGQCCPYANMTVRNDTCIWCMDPSQLTTVMVNGCGRCKPGTFEHLGRCLIKQVPDTGNRFSITDPASDGLTWAADIGLASDAQTGVVLFLHTRYSYVHPCTLAPQQRSLDCLLLNTSVGDGQPILIANHEAKTQLAQQLDIPRISLQYLQFDRGRYTLNVTQSAVRNWTACAAAVCRGAIGALFITWFNDGTFQARAQILPLRFNFGIPGMITTIGGSQTPALARMELHSFPDRWALRLIGVQMRGECVYLQWDTGAVGRVDYRAEDDFTTIDPPPSQGWSTLRVTECLNRTTLAIHQPAKIVVHQSTVPVKLHGIVVAVQYGFNFSTTPGAGDSEQITFITAKSPQPIRLKSLSASAQGFTVMYTTSKGFIIDTSRVLDLGLACIRPTSVLTDWITRAIAILPDQPPAMLEAFVQASCAKLITNQVSRAYWMVPARAPTTRTASNPMTIVAEFV
jgi:hypothetical protein